MSTDVSKSTAPDFCRHPRIGEDGFCIDCGRRAAIKLNTEVPQPCFQCGDPLCLKEEHLIRGTHSPFANREHTTSAQLIAAGEASPGFCKKCRCCNVLRMSRDCACECHVTKPRNLSKSTDELKSDINWGLRQIALIELLREVFKVISHATHRVKKTPPPTKGLTTWECMPDCLKCRIGEVLAAAENSEQKHEAENV